jgi:hypothetical protein
MFMIDTKKIFLVTHDFEDGTFEVSTLHNWMKLDQDMWLIPRKRKKTSWLIVAAYDSREEAQKQVEKLEKEHVA